MSKLSEQREREDAAPRSGPGWPWIMVAAAILIAAWIGYDVYRFYDSKVSTLDGFAKCLTSRGAHMYGAWWCPHCAEQKESFGNAFEYVKYTECGIENQLHSENEQCKQAGIKHFPTWQFADGSRKEGTLPLAELSQKTGCKLP